jgi:hypothetical protein
MAVLCYLDEGAEGQAVQVRLKIDGVTWQTLTLDDSTDYRYGKLDETDTPGISRTWTAGEVVTADILQVGTDSPGTGLHVLIGTDKQGGNGTTTGPDLHGDMLQFFSSTKDVFDPIMRDTVWGGSNGKTFQVANTLGRWALDNCYVGRHTGSAHGLGSDANIDYFVSFCAFQGNQTVSDEANVSVLRYCNGAGFTGGDSPDASNVVAAQGKMPACPDLATVWPDCPYVI